MPLVAMDTRQHPRLRDCHRMGLYQSTSLRVSATVSDSTRRSTPAAVVDQIVSALDHGLSGRQLRPTHVTKNGPGAVAAGRRREPRWAPPSLGPRRWRGRIVDLGRLALGGSGARGAVARAEPSQAAAAQARRLAAAQTGAATDKRGRFKYRSEPRAAAARDPTGRLGAA